MGLLMTAAVILLPLLLIALQWMFGRWSFLIDAAALLCALCAGIIAALAVYEIRRDGTVFMTDIHKLFTNDLFLLTSGYLGIYGIAKLCMHMFNRYRAL
ncbi:transposase [Paenibacillus sp. MBLB4367]|uniref:transposase n=1 Tax=Paenibacillus sp. MBLB4367 TaxID=3384767 RepID=UPI003907F83E